MQPTFAQLASAYDACSPWPLLAWGIHRYALGIIRQHPQAVYVMLFVIGEQPVCIHALRATCSLASGVFKVRGFWSSCWMWPVTVTWRSRHQSQNNGMKLPQMRCRGCSSVREPSVQSLALPPPKSKAKDWHQRCSHCKTEEQTIRKWDTLVWWPQVEFMSWPLIDAARISYMYIFLTTWASDCPLVMDVKTNQEQCVPPVAANISFKRYRQLKDSACGGMFKCSQARGSGGRGRGNRSVSSKTQWPRRCGTTER